MRFIFAFILITTLYACGDENTQKDFSYLPDASGGYSTVNVIADEALWNEGLKDLIKPVLTKEIDGLISLEREFDIKNIRSKAFNRLFQRQRLILLFVISKKVGRPGVSIKKDVYANGQVIIQVAARSKSAVKTLFKQKKEEILAALSAQRTAAIQKLACKENNPKLESLIQNSHGISLTIPKSYKLGVDTTNFIYFFKKGSMKCEKFSHNKCYYQTGIFAYYLPYTTKKIFTPEYFNQMRDSITQIYIEGPKPSNNLRSYMQVYDGLPLATQNITLNNKFGYKVKGWWDMKNGTMGGPFVSTAYVDEIRGRVLVVDAFVFGPNFNKRRFIKELEAICLTLKSAEEGI